MKFISELSTITVEPILPTKKGMFTSEEKIAYTRGVVVARGIDCKLSSAVGDTIIFGEYSGTEFEFEDTTYKVLAEAEVKITIPKPVS